MLEEVREDGRGRATQGEEERRENEGEGRKGGKVKGSVFGIRKGERLFPVFYKIAER